MSRLEDVLVHAQALLRLDTSNPGSSEERAAAYVVDVLQAAGLQTEVLEPEPGRCSVISRQPGRDPSLAPLVMHAHLDVVPAEDGGWTHDPFGAVIDDGCLWGRGTADMKTVAAMMLWIQQGLAASGPPRRDLIFAYFADEERGGVLGSGWVVENRPELFTGAREAIGEFGGFPAVTLDGRRLYPVLVGEKGLLWMRLAIEGRAGHAALDGATNATVRLADLIHRVAALHTHDAPPDMFEHSMATLAELAPGAEKGEDVLVGGLGTLGGLLRRGRATTFEPTAVSAGSNVNVVPGQAELLVDCRFVPGGEEAAMRAIEGALDDGITCEVIHRSPGASSPVDGELVAAFRSALQTVDRESEILPILCPGFTDGQSLAQLGIHPYGFTPLIFDDDGFDYIAMFHAVDERLPLTAIDRGAAVLDHLLRSY